MFILFQKYKYFENSFNQMLEIVKENLTPESNHKKHPGEKEHIQPG